jgi:uncharacterized protein
VVLLEPLPLGELELAPPEGEVVLELLLPGVVVVDDDEPLEVVSDERGVVAVPGEADGLLGGVVVTRSVSVLLQAVKAPPTSARAQRPESSLFIADAPPVWGVATHLPGCNGHARGARRWLDSAGFIHYYCGLRPDRVPCDPRKGDRAMKLEGAHDVPAPRQKVWDAFLDPARLRQAIPGCEKLEALGNDEYKAIMKVGVGGVKGTFEGKVRLSDKKAPDSYKMAVEGSGGPGFVRGETVITLSDIEGGTRVAYNADLQVGGLIASVGQRMLGGVSKMMADKFFGKMSDLLKGKK